MIIKLLIIALAGIICGLLGSYAGAEGTPTSIRKIGIPIFLAVIGYFVLGFLSLILLLLYIPLSRGYGVPCWKDKGSVIGKFLYNLIKKYKPALYEIEVQDLASILTRGIIGLLVCLSVILIPFIKGNWLIYLLTSVGIVLVYTIVSWRGWGCFRFLRKDLIFAEFYTYLAIGLGISIIIFF
jgi:predicted membrane protein